MCEAGGTLKPSVNFMTGKTSRSLKAAYRVLTEGDAPGIAHLEGGMYGWCAARRRCASAACAAQSVRARHAPKLASRQPTRLRSWQKRAVEGAGMGAV